LRAGFASDDESKQLIRENLGATSARQRVLALRAGARRSLLNNDDWLNALRDDEVDVRREVITLVAHENVSDTTILDALVNALNDPDALVVDAAAFALGEHAYTASVVPLCAVATSHDDARCRESAVAALGAIGDDRGRGAVLGALDDKPPVRRRAIVALSNFEGPDIEAALVRASEDRDWQVRAAVNQLARENED
jgi:HEAT repeat protein